MKLYSSGTPREQLLFLLLGIPIWGGEESSGLLLGIDEPPPEASKGTNSQLYSRLPDTSAPLQETKRLARLLGSAVGQGEIPL
jgi:hypothetical protein